MDLARGRTCTGSTPRSAAACIPGASRLERQRRPESPATPPGRCAWCAARRALQSTRLWRSAAPYDFSTGSSRDKVCVAIVEAERREYGCTTPRESKCKHHKQCEMQRNFTLKFCFAWIRLHTINEGSTPLEVSLLAYSLPVSSLATMPMNWHARSPSGAMLANPFVTLAALPPGFLRAFTCQNLDCPGLPAVNIAT